MRDIAAHIVMPQNSSAVKVRAVEGYGAKVYLCEPTQTARESMAVHVVKQTGGTLIPPYNHPDVIAGQGTLALEMLQDEPELDAIIAPIGGGGMVSGVCIAARGVKPDIRLFAAEPKGADDAFRSMKTGQLQAQGKINTIADGLLTAMGDLTWPIVRDHVERVITVSDQEIIAAMRLVWERMKLVIEPSAATSVAAALSDEFTSLDPSPKRVGVVLSGGNVDLDKLPWVKHAAGVSTA
jgi:threonine dehydratase/serine racemase